MAKQTIDIGAAPNDGTGDALRTAFRKANDNFTELYGSTTSIGGATGTLAIPFGQCILVKSGSNIVLKPKNGNLLTIGGSLQVIPDAGVSLAPTGLTAGTAYFIYAYMNAGVMTLEASTTGHAASTTAGNKGVEIKSGDNTRSLVGFAQPVTGPAWSDSDTSRLVRSWFNRQSVRCKNGFTTTRTSTSTSAAVINSEITIEALLWDDELWALRYSGVAYNTSNGSVTTYIALDSTSAGVASVYHASGANVGESAALSYTYSAVGAEGYHYATLLGRVSSGTTGGWEHGSQSTSLLMGDIL